MSRSVCRTAGVLLSHAACASSPCSAAPCKEIKQVATGDITVQDMAPLVWRMKMDSPAATEISGGAVQIITTTSTTTLPGETASSSMASPSTASPTTTSFAYGRLRRVRLGSAPTALRRMGSSKRWHTSRPWPDHIYTGP